jgi:hypothetical protein
LLHYVRLAKPLLICTYVTCAFEIALVTDPGRARVRHYDHPIASVSTRNIPLRTGRLTIYGLTHADSADVKMPVSSVRSTSGDWGKDIFQPTSSLTYSKNPNTRSPNLHSTSPIIIKYDFASSDLQESWLPE